MNYFSDRFLFYSFFVHFYMVDGDMLTKSKSIFISTLCCRSVSLTLTLFLCKHPKLDGGIIKFWSTIQRKQKTILPFFQCNSNVSVIEIMKERTRQHLLNLIKVWTVTNCLYYYCIRNNIEDQNIFDKSFCSKELVGIPSY